MEACNKDKGVSLAIVLHCLFKPIGAESKANCALTLSDILVGTNFKKQPYF